MVLQIFPEPSQSTVNSFTVEIPSSKKYKKYKLLKNFDAGVYSITTSPNTSNATISFFDSDEAIVLTTATTSGALTYSLASEKPGAYINVDSDASTLIIFELTSINLVSNSLSGTVDTVTSSGTYNSTGKLYVLAVGGGGAGQCGFGVSSGGNYAGGRGGNGGASTSSIIYTNTATTITIGSGGNLNTAQQNRTVGALGNAGGTTSFGNLFTAVGGFTEVGSSGAYTANQPEVINYALDVYAGNNGGGGSGSGEAPYPPITANGTGSGIGSGGGGGSFGSTGGDANAATGYGAGGGGGGVARNTNTVGKPTAGTSGVVYVLRGF
jgi:hypothetical protein